MPRFHDLRPDHRDLRKGIPNLLPHQPSSINQNASPLADSNQRSIRTGKRFSDIARGSQRRESAAEMSSYSLVAQDPFPLVDPGSAGSFAEVPSTPNGFDSLDPTQDSYEFDFRQMCAKLRTNETVYLFQFQMNRPYQ